MTDMAGALTVGAPDRARLGWLAVRGSIWSVVGTAGRSVVSLGATAVLARLVSPADYGLLAMGGTLIVFLQVFADGGLSWASVQRERLAWDDVHALFAVNTLVGLGLWGACAVAAPAVAAFYGRQELIPLLAVMGGTFFLAGLGVQPLSLLRRQMQHRRTAVVDIVAMAGGAAIGIGAALRGLGLWALVLQAVGGRALHVVLLFVASGYRPGRPRWTPELQGLLAFGGWVAGYGFVNYFARNLDNVLVGKVLGAEELGFYTRAYFLMMLPTLLSTQAVTPAVLPALSRLQNDRVAFGRMYRRATVTVAAFAVPAAVGMLLTAPELVRLVYGPGWEPVVPLLVLLALAGIVQPVHNTMGWLFLAHGAARAMFWWGFGAAVGLSTAFFVGVRYGTEGVAAAYGIVMAVVISPAALIVAHRTVGLRLAETIRAVVPILMGTLVMAGAVLAVDRGLEAAFENTSSLRDLGLKITVGIMVYGITVLVQRRRYSR